MKGSRIATEMIGHLSVTLQNLKASKAGEKFEHFKTSVCGHRK